jgi:hypothetical protein
MLEDEPAGAHSMRDTLDMLVKLNCQFMAFGVVCKGKETFLGHFLDGSPLLLPVCVSYVSKLTHNTIGHSGRQEKAICILRVLLWQYCMTLERYV